MSSETWEIIRKLRGDEIELQIAFQCAPLITGLKESNLLNIRKQDYQRMKDIFKESELTIYPLGIHAGEDYRVPVSQGAPGKIFFPGKVCLRCYMRSVISTQT